MTRSQDKTTADAARPAVSEGSRCCPGEPNTALSSHTTSGACLGAGPLIWRQVNREFYNCALDPDPVEREFADEISEYEVQNPRYRYRYPAAHEYYKRLDAFNASPPLSDETVTGDKS